MSILKDYGLILVCSSSQAMNFLYTSKSEVTCFSAWLIPWFSVINTDSALYINIESVTMCMRGLMVYPWLLFRLHQYFVPTTGSPTPLDYSCPPQTTPLAITLHLASIYPGQAKLTGFHGSKTKKQSRWDQDKRYQWAFGINGMVNSKASFQKQKDKWSTNTWKGVQYR